MGAAKGGIFPVGAGHAGPVDIPFNSGGAGNWIGASGPGPITQGVDHDINLKISQLQATSRPLNVTFDTDYDWIAEILGIKPGERLRPYPAPALPEATQAVLDALREENKELTAALAARESEIKEANQRVVFLTELLKTLISNPELANGIAAKL